MEVISNVYLWLNSDMVMVFDEGGQQLPDYQGPFEEVSGRVLADAPPTAHFHTGGWSYGEPVECSRTNWGWIERTSKMMRGYGECLLRRTRSA